MRLLNSERKAEAFKQSRIEKIGGHAPKDFGGRGVMRAFLLSEIQPAPRCETKVLGHAEVILIVRLVHKSLFANYFPVIIDKDVAHNGIHQPLKLVWVQICLRYQALKVSLATNHSLLPGRLSACMQAASSSLMTKSLKL